MYLGLRLVIMASHLGLRDVEIAWLDVFGM